MQASLARGSNPGLKWDITQCQSYKTSGERDYGLWGCGWLRGILHSWRLKKIAANFPKPSQRSSNLIWVSPFPGNSSPHSTLKLEQAFLCLLFHFPHISTVPWIARPVLLTVCPAGYLRWVHSLQLQSKQKPETFQKHRRLRVFLE